MKEKLKGLELRLTELSHYLGISRPTLYKYIDDFDRRRYKNIDTMILDLFRFINMKTTTSKIQVINFIIKGQKSQLGMSQPLMDEIERLVINEERGEELTELIKLFRLSDSKTVIKEIIDHYLRSDET
jgi:hypothetical protein